MNSPERLRISFAKFSEIFNKFSLNSSYNPDTLRTWGQNSAQNTIPTFMTLMFQVQRADTKEILQYVVWKMAISTMSKKEEEKYSLGKMDRRREKM